jgi:hypothetical protein
MPRKQEPTVIAVLDYFETAPLEAARLALQLAARAIRKREPKLAGGGKKQPATTTVVVETEKPVKPAKVKPATAEQAPPVGQQPAGAVPAV